MGVGGMFLKIISQKQRIALQRLAKLCLKISIPPTIRSSRESGWVVYVSTNVDSHLKLSTKV